MRFYVHGDDSLKAELQATQQALSSQCAPEHIDFISIDESRLGELQGSDFVISRAPLNTSCLAQVVLFIQPEEVVAANQADWLILRGAHVEQQLRQLICKRRQSTQINFFDNSLQGIISHDFGGGIGIVSLVSQLLKTKDADSSLAKKLDAAGEKLRALMSDVAAMSENMRDSDKQPPSAPASRETVALEDLRSDLQTWFSAVHRGRELQLSEFAVNKQPNPIVDLRLLRWLVDGLARLTQKESQIQLSLPSEGERRVQLIGQSAYPVSQVQSLFQRAAHADSQEQSSEAIVMPFRLRLAAESLQKRGIKLQSACSETGAINLSFFLPEAEEAIDSKN